MFSAWSRPYALIKLASFVIARSLTNCPYFPPFIHRRQLLASMIAESDEKDQVTGAILDEIPFTVVSEPNDNDDDDDDAAMEATVTGDECEDLGNATIRLKDILNREKDVVDEELPVYGGNDDKAIVGHLRVSVECLTTLKKVKAEMDAATTMSASGELTKEDLTLSQTKSLLQ